LAQSVFSYHGLPTKLTLSAFNPSILPSGSGTEPSVQLTSLGCYYSFTGGTTCWNHTLYGWYCLTGSWYCQLLGSCRWIAIGSCR
jgi:hypothetical protein